MEKKTSKFSEKLNTALIEERNNLIYDRAKKYIKGTQINGSSTKFPRIDLIEIKENTDSVVVEGFFNTINWVELEVKTRYKVYLDSNLKPVKIDFIKSDYIGKKIENKTKKQKKKKVVINIKHISFSLLFLVVVVIGFLLKNREAAGRRRYYSLSEKKSIDISQNRYIGNYNSDYYDRILVKLKNKMDMENPKTREFYVKLASKSPGSYNVGQIAHIYNYLYRNWKYVSDPNGKEYFAKASESIGSGFAGDCDDFAILMATCIEGIGGRARIVFAESNKGGHAYAEVCIINQDIGADAVIGRIGDYINDMYGRHVVKNLKYRTDPDGLVWLNLDWNGPSPGSEYFKADKEWIFDLDKNTYRYREL